MRQTVALQCTDKRESVSFTQATCELLWSFFHDMVRLSDYGSFDLWVVVVKKSSSE